jgi:hypothetical protein
MSEIVINIRIVIRKEVRLLYLKMLLELFRDNGMKNYAKSMRNFFLKLYKIKNKKNHSYTSSLKFSSLKLHFPF